MARYTNFDTGTPEVIGLSPPLTTRGDLVAQGTSGLVRVPVGTSGQLLGSNGTDPLWQSFVQGGTGPVARTWQSKLQELPSIVDYGAVGDGSTDNTTAIQNAVNYAVSTSGVLFINPGNFKITAPISVTGPLRLIGVNLGDSSITLGSSTQNGFNITTIAAIHFSDFSINGLGSGSQTAGTAILVQPSSGENDNTTFDNMGFSNNWNAFDFERAANFHITNSQITFNNAQFIVVRNLNNADSGDSFITSCLFLNTGAQTTNQTAIYQESSGGLKMIGNKFNGMYRAYWLNAATGIASSDTIFEGNSLENYTNIGVLLGTQTPAAAQWRNVHIIGNQFLQQGATTAFQVSAANTPTWILDVIFGHNVVGFNNTGSGGIGVFVDFSTTVMTINNVFENLSGTAGTAISYSANASLGYIGGNQFRMNGAGTTISNSSTDTLIDDITGVTFANIPSIARIGSRIYVTDGTPGSPLAGGGNGSLALRNNPGPAWKGL